MNSVGDFIDFTAHHVTSDPGIVTSDHVVSRATELASEGVDGLTTMVGFGGCLVHVS